MFAFEEYIIAEKDIKMLQSETLFILVNATLYEHGPRFCFYEYGPNMAPKNGKIPISKYF